MSAPPPLPRHYTSTELRAAALISPKVWNQRFASKRGPLYYATGPWWPIELRRLAADAERRAKAMRVVADAMEREGCCDQPGGRGS